MSSTDLSKIAHALVADGTGILAADETVPTVTKCLAALMIESTPEIRRVYREMFFTTPGISDFISGVIMQDETIHQEDDNQTPLADLLIRQGIIPGVKVDNGAKPLAGSPQEHITEGLDGLRDRLREYGKLGARFAKWRAVIEVSDTLPSPGCVQANAHALARYAAICQE
jgi:fructose-bisphosphate aldolase, class I